MDRRETTKSRLDAKNERKYTREVLVRGTGIARKIRSTGGFNLQIRIFPSRRGSTLSPGDASGSLASFALSVLVERTHVIICARYFPQAVQPVRDTASCW